MGHSSGANVFAATGSATLVLYRMGNQVLVHAAAQSSLLTIRVPGQLMSGAGVDEQGNTFKTTWRCLVGAAGSASAPGGVGAIRAGARQPTSLRGARGVC